MPEKDLQNFYNDRRKRGLSDLIIFNELEASGWTKEGLREHLAEARTAYEKLPGADFMDTAEVLEYDIPQQPKPKHYGRILTTLATTTIYTFLAWQETHDWVLIIPAFAIYGFMGFLTLFSLFVKVSNTPRRIRLDSQNITVLDPPGHPHTWTSYVGYRAGKKQLTEEEQPEPSVSSPIYLFWKPKTPTRSVIRFYTKKRWMGMTSTNLALTLPLPPGREARVVSLVSKYLPALYTNDVTNGTGVAWKIFTIGMGFVALFLIWAIISVLV